MTLSKQAPLFELPYIHNHSSIYKLEEDLGKVIVLTFWASWCPDCGKDLPMKEQLFKTMDHDKVKMMTINVTGRERNIEEGIEFKEKFLTQPTLSDEGRYVYDLYNCDGVPSTIIINQQGEIHANFGDQSSFLDIVSKLGEIV
ncbi:TlpA family protein disulfide reductase [Halobacillus trueperi]|uniref:TlpA family protein disulfide reductase n=1 Tax=Halobacillus trueperi TaxID=156205 RepID=A0A3E0JAX4_9BACI|nr:TlpA disulfide reductase family protein [Halobacillus trueperi]REJ10062.1 TlpA family protein disulfide reductase [Halobacillus trueperi]